LIYTGIYLNKGDFYSILTDSVYKRGFLRVMMGQEWVYGNTYHNKSPFSGPLSVGCQAMLPLGVDIFVWAEEDYDQISGVLEKIKEENPKSDDVILSLDLLKKYNKIATAQAETYIEKTSVKKPPPKESIKSKPFTYPDIDFGPYYALVIGNNNYQFLPKLLTAKNDAQEVAKILKNRYGFNVELLIDANRSDILVVLSNLRWNLVNRDNLLIYYAGHGWLDKEADEGYWLPINAEKDNMINWISNSSITATLRAIKAKHVLIIADSCYSGKLARGIHTVNRTPGYLSKLAQKRARCVISSGGLEPVIDSGGRGEHSVFTSAFLDALKENTGIMDGAQLFNKLRRPVMLNSDQTPEYSDIRRAGHEGGEFLFVRKK
jgi:uncharacterized caspase-like protein